MWNATLLQSQNKKTCFSKDNVFVFDRSYSMSFETKTTILFLILWKVDCLKAQNSKVLCSIVLHGSIIFFAIQKMFSAVFVPKISFSESEPWQGNVSIFWRAFLKSSKHSWFYKVDCATCLSFHISHRRCFTKPCLKENRWARKWDLETSLKCNALIHHLTSLFRA